MLNDLFAALEPVSGVGQSLFIGSSNSTQVSSAPSRPKGGVGTRLPSGFLAEEYHLHPQYPRLYLLHQPGIWPEYGHLQKPARVGQQSSAEFVMESAD